MGKKKVEPIPCRLEEVDTRRNCVTTESMALLNNVLDRRAEKYPDVRLRLFVDGRVWTEDTPDKIRRQLGRVSGEGH